MKEIIFSCEVITPMFLNGADGQTPELRAPSIKGAMRFWWRALNGHLSLVDLKKRESEIFGGSGEKVQRSNIIIQMLSKNETRTSTHELVPHKPFMKANAFNPGTMFEIRLMLKEFYDENGIIYFTVEHLESLFCLTCYLGGFGKRVRRGMGSVNIQKIVVDGNQKVIPDRIDLGLIHNYIAKFNQFYRHVDENKIVFTYPGGSPQYGYVSEIQLGRSYVEQNVVLSKISSTTHMIKEKYRYAYDPSMGHAFKGRYASPVYVSIVRGSIRPIITTLNLAPDRDANQASLLIQQDFKNQIL